MKFFWSVAIDSIFCRFKILQVLLGYIDDSSYPSEVLYTACTDAYCLYCIFHVIYCVFPVIYCIFPVIYCILSVTGSGNGK